MSVSQVSGCLSCQHGISLERLLPHLDGVVVEAADLAGSLCLRAHARADHGVCPRCEQPSGRVHSTYGRRMADAPAGGHPVVIRLAVRRFFCGNPDCAAITFAEQIEGLTSRRARRTPPLARILTGIAVALAGRAGERLAALLDLTAGRSSMLRLVMALPDTMLYRLVAHRTCAIIEAEERGLADILGLEFEPVREVLSSVLTYCDITTSPDGELVPAKGDLPRSSSATAPGTW